jgi:hypothetical protein
VQVCVLGAALDLVHLGRDPAVQVRRVVRRLAVAVGREQQQQHVLLLEPLVQRRARREIVFGVRHLDAHARLAAVARAQLVAELLREALGRAGLGAVQEAHGGPGVLLGRGGGRDDRERPGLLAPELELPGLVRGVDRVGRLGRRAQLEGDAGDDQHERERAEQQDGVHDCWRGGFDWGGMAVCCSLDRQTERERETERRGAAPQKSRCRFPSLSEHAHGDAPQTPGGRAGRARTDGS